MRTFHLLAFGAAFLLSATGIAAPVEIPFDLVNRHIMLNVVVNQSKPLRFMLDTGDKYAIIDRARATELGLELGGGVHVVGNGGATAATFVQGAVYSIPGLRGFTQPVVLAFPLTSLEPRLGARFDGIIGSEFISQFVVEIDYDKRVLRLHDPKTFNYAGPGEAVPVRFNHSGHPILSAEVTPVGKKPIEGEFVLDLGAPQAVTLRAPVVTRLGLPGSGVKTLQLVGVAGAGGKTAGQVGRVESVRIGRFVLKRPLATFSADQAGALASDETLGSFGEELASRFRLFLDYQRGRIIFEPLPHYDAPFDRAVSGASIDAAAPFQTFRVSGVAPDSPAAQAGLKIGDVIREIDRQPAAGLTLTRINEILGRPGTHRILVTRGTATIDVTLRSAEL